MKSPQPTEHEIQCAIIKWADLNAARHPELRMLFAIPNGGWRHPVTAAKLKAEGVRAGVPDLFLAVANMHDKTQVNCHGLFLEIKRGTMGRVREQQALWAGALKAHGYRVEVARSSDEAINIIRGYLNI